MQASDGPRLPRRVFEALPLPKGLRRSLKLAAVDRRRVWRNVLPAVAWTFTSASMGGQAHVARTN